MDDLHDAYVGKRAFRGLKLCTGCLKVAYCCKVHQELDREFHKLSCVRGGDVVKDRRVLEWLRRDILRLGTQFGQRKEE